MERVDFRSDTVSWPTPAMREAMACAAVGDDVYGEDPTVNTLEMTAAAMLGKEAGLFVASGTMGNLVGILTHAQRGEEAIVGMDAHTYLDEAGGMAVLGGVTPHPLPTDECGRMSLSDIEAAIRPDNVHFPITRLILVENSYGEKNGYPIEPAYFATIRTLANQHGLAIHLDGARFFNAATALNLSPATLAQDVDSLSVCLSKGLCAPVGSVLCGSETFIRRARRIRKLVGGGMRQAGVLAAAGLLALRDMTQRLHEDHAHAHYLAQGLAQIPGIHLNLDTIKTNIVFFNLTPDFPLASQQLVTRLREHNLWVNATGPRQLRVVTHYWITLEHVQLFLATIQKIANTPFP
ncbi:MAG: low-specificity L-threonine aldolase [Chloroflexi bacterium]|nr:low-specificity L-threonine aldolase [Chloroflexota bacterium]MBP8057041.1 low-specificity L-threonine aldolase [Chloroflexota bacterium]